MPAERSTLNPKFEKVLEAQVARGDRAQEQLDKAKADGRKLDPKFEKVFEAQVAQGRRAQAALDREKAGEKASPGSSSKPDSDRPAAGGDRPGSVGDRGDDDRPAPSFGDRRDRSAPEFAPSYTAQPRYVEPPRYTSQPSVKPRPVSDEPTCVQGTWAKQNGEKKYVCLSWHFRGQIYTPDQLEIVLAELGRPRPALLGS